MDVFVLVLGDEPSYRTSGTSVADGDKRSFPPYRRVSMWECHDCFSIRAFPLVSSSSFLARRLFASPRTALVPAAYSHDSYSAANRCCQWWWVVTSLPPVRRSLFGRETSFRYAAYKVLWCGGALDTCVNGRRRRPTTIVETRPGPDTRTVMWTDPGASDVYARAFSPRHP